MIRAVIFDLDGTLYPLKPSTTLALERAQAYAVREMSLPPEQFRAEYDKALARQLSDHVGTFCYHSRIIRFQLVCESLGLPIRYAPRLAAAYWEGYLEPMKPFDGVAEALGKLKRQGLRLGVGTNMTAEWQFSKLEKLGLIDSFDFIVTSEEAGVEKPAAAFFRYCANKAKLPVGECLFVGDNLEYDVRGATAAGLKALWLQADPAQREAADVPSIASWSELPGSI